MSPNGQEERGVVEYQARDGQKIKLTREIIKNYLVSGRAEFVTDQEMVLYMGVCKARGLNPFVKDCHLVKYTQGDAAAIITSIDYYRKRARAQKDCKGWSVGIVIIGKQGGELSYRKGTILLDEETLVGGWAEAKPEGWTEPMRKEVNLKRYIKKTKDGGVTGFWHPDNQPEMIAKVAESQLLRALWPDEFQGLYVDSEVQSRDAQEELHGAVSTATGPGAADGPRFEEVFAAECAHLMFGEFVGAAADTYGITVDEMKAKMLSQVADVKAGFRVWVADREARAAVEKKAAVSVEAETAPAVQVEQEGAPAESEPVEVAEVVKSFRDEWADLGPKEFGVFVRDNLKRFEKAEAEVRAEAVDKWNGFYQGFPCPFEGKGAAPAQARAADPADPEAAAKAELDLLQAEIRRVEKGEPDLVAAARANLGIVARTTPNNIDGCVRLIDTIKDLRAHKDRKKGGRR